MEEEGLQESAFDYNINQFDACFPSLASMESWWEKRHKIMINNNIILLYCIVLLIKNIEWRVRMSWKFGFNQIHSDEKSS